MKGGRIYAEILFYVYLAGLLLAIIATGLEGLGKIDELFTGKMPVEMGALARLSVYLLILAIPIALISELLVDRDKTAILFIVVILIAIAIAAVLKVG